MLKTPIPTVTPNYNDENRRLFTRRVELADEIAELSKRRSAAARRKVAASTREMEDVTAEIVTLNFGLVRSYVSRFTSHTSSDDSADFEAAGLVGLMRAIDNYDPGLGPFAQWAYRPIKREVLRAVRDADHPNMNPGDFEKRPDILRAAAKLLKETGVVATNDEVAALVGCSPDQVARVLQAPHLGSLSAPVGSEEGESSVGDMLPDAAPEPADAVLSAMSVSALEAHGLTALDPRELFVIVRRYGLDGEPPQRLSSIGTQLKLSREAARQIEAKAISKLAHPNTLRRLVRQH